MWQTHQTCVFYQPDEEKLDEVIDIALFDMDGTLTNSASGKIWVTKDDDPTDWTYLGRVLERLDSLKKDGWIIAIVSNQSKYNDGILAKFENIRADIHKNLGWSPFIFMATKKDRYRKPDTGMPELLLKLLGITKKQVNSFVMCGDMIDTNDPYPAFRLGSTDYELSTNIDRHLAPCTFHRPTYMFGENFNDPDILIKTVKGPEVILMMGNQGSGKSTTAAKFGYEIVNQDTLGTKPRVLKKIKELTSRRVDFVIDATHPSRDKRDEMLSEPRLAGYHVRIFWMIRNGQPFDATRPKKMHPAAYASYSKTFDKPTDDEGSLMLVY